MRLLLIVVGALVAVTAVLLVLGCGLCRLCGWLPSWPWRRVLLVVVCSIPVHALITTPLVLGWVGSRMVRTRSSERGDHEVRIGSARSSVVVLRASDGVRLRAFWVPPPVEPARCTAVLVHGLFRSARELEPVGAMFRDLGAEVLLLELRNHGGSGRAPATFGKNESLDVAAAVEWARGRPDQGGRPLVLFGVSLGTAAVSLALRRIDPVEGLVLDAPISRLLPVAHRMLGAATRADGRGILLPQPFRSLVLTSVELWSGFRFADVRPIDGLRDLSPDTAVLLVGAGDDVRVPPAEVRSLFEVLPTPPSRKWLWIREGSRHGRVWRDDPEGYRRRLAELLDVAAPRGR